LFELLLLDEFTCIGNRSSRRKCFTFLPV